MIAISYRRQDSLPIAGRLYDRLQAKFGKENVFMDFDSIPPGVDFREQIKQTIERSNLVIAIIGPQWLGERSDGSRRIDDPTDFVRLEIEYALKGGIPVIPLLINDTPMPKPEKLPPVIEKIAFRNALPLDSGLDFHQHVDRLVSGIEELTGPKLGNEIGEKTPSQIRSGGKLVLITGAAIVLAAAAFWWFAIQQPRFMAEAKRRADAADSERNAEEAGKAAEVEQLRKEREAAEAKRRADATEAERKVEEARKTAAAEQLRKEQAAAEALSNGQAPANKTEAGGTAGSNNPKLLTRSFHISPADNVFGLRAMLDGTYTVAEGYIELNVPRMYLITKRNRRVSTVRLGLGFIVDDQIWDVMNKVDAFSVNKEIVVGETYRARPFTIRIPATSTDLSKNWLIVEVETSEADPQHPVGYLYVHSQRDIFTAR